MTIRGKTFFRGRNVCHVEIGNLTSVRAFQSNADFSVPQKKDKLRDLVDMMSMLDPKERYEWFYKPL